MSDLENKIAASRRFFNNAVQEYNTGIQQLPAALFAGMFGFTTQGFLRPRRQPDRGRGGADGEVLSPQDIPAEQRIMAAYGLYTHIASNKFRSMLLLAGLFLLIYVLVYAGALLAEVVIDSDGSVDYYLMAAARDLVDGVSLCDRRRGALDRDRLFLPPDHDRCRHRRRGRDAEAAAAALQSAGKPLHLARHSDAETEDHGQRRR